jgi:hypothetical protein
MFSPFPIQALAASIKLSVSLQLLDLGQPVGLLGRVDSSSQGLYLYTYTEKRTHNTNTKHPCPEWDSNPRSRRPRKRRQFMPISSCHARKKQDRRGKAIGRISQSSVANAPKAQLMSHRKHTSSTSQR